MSYVIRRVFNVRSGEARRAATLIDKMGNEYEKSGQRTKSRVYYNGGTTPGNIDKVYMEWEAERIESPYRGGNIIPKEVRDVGSRLRDLALVESQSIEFYELINPDKYQE